MVYITFPSTLTEEEEMLKQKYAKLRKKRKTLQAMKTAKPESQQKNAEQSAKRSAESAEEATEQAKKLVQSGAIKVGSGSREKKGFKRSKNLEKKLKETDKSVGFTPFEPSHSGEEDEKTESVKPRMKTLYESFTPAGGSEYDGESRRSGPGRRDREPPAKGHTVFVHGHGVTEDIIRKHFSNFGNIVNISMEQDKHKAFVSFEKTESAEQAIANTNGSMVSDIQLEVSMAIRQPTFENSQDTSSASWASMAANNTQKGPSRKVKETRELLKYDNDMFLQDTSSASCASMAANNTQKSPSQKDKETRELVKYDNDIF